MSFPCGPNGATANAGSDARIRATSEYQRCYREVFVHASDALFVIDVESSGRFVFDTLNPAAEEAFRAPLSVLRGASFDALVCGTESGDFGASLAKHRVHFDRCARTGMPVDFEGPLDLHPVRGTNAAEFQVRLLPLAGDRGIERIIGLGRDITVIKQTERELRASRTLLQELSIHYQDAREQERKHIARELHEELGQLLSALRMDISTLPLQLDRHPDVREKAAGMLALLDEGIGELRSIVTALRPVSLDAGIAASLEWLSRDFSVRTGIECALSLPDDLDLPEDQATAVFRIVQEALSNVARHSGARRVRIALLRDGESWKLTVADDGCGFDADRRPKSSFGILGMRERALALGGVLNVNSDAADGSTITLTFPAYVANP